MADKEIGDLTDGSAAASGDLLHVVRSGNSRKATLGNAAGKSTGTGSGDVAAGDHSHSHFSDTGNPHSVTKSQVGLGNVTNDAQIAASLLTTRGDIIYRDASAPARLAKGTQGHVLRAGANDPEYGTLTAAAFATGPGIITPAMLENFAALTVLGRSANSSGAAATIAAGANDRLLSRVSDALGFNQLTAGMVPNAILTYAMLASAALASAGEYRSATASKLLSAAAAWSAAELAALTDGANIAVDMSAGFNFGGTSNAPLALGGNRTLSNPSNEKIGQSGVMLFTASSSTRTLSISSEYKPATGVESFPISITTTETVALCYWIQSTSVTWITNVLRRTT